MINLRTLKPTLPPRLLALIAFGEIGLTFHLLFPAGNASLCQPFPGFTSLGQPPVRVDWLTVDQFRAIGIVCKDVTNTFSREISFIHNLVGNSGSS